MAFVPWWRIAAGTQFRRHSAPLPTERGPCGSRGLRQRVSGLGAARLARGGHELAQYLDGGLRPGLAELAHGRGQGAPERRRHGKAGETLLQRLEPPVVGSFGGG